MTQWMRRGEKFVGADMDVEGLVDEGVDDGLEEEN